MAIEHLEVLYHLERYDQLLEMAAPLQGDDAEGVQASLYAIAALMAKGDWPQAWAQVERVRPACAAVGQYWYLSATVLRQLGRIDEAEEAIDTALKQSPSDADYLCEKALLAWQRDRIGDTKRYLDLALAQAPLHAQSLLCLAVLYGFDLQRPDLGMRILRGYLAREPNCPHAHFLLAEMEPRLWRKARHFRRLLGLTPLDHEARQGYRRYGRGLGIRVILIVTLMAITLLANLFAGDAPWQTSVIGASTLGMLLVAASLFELGRQWPGIVLATHGVVLTLPMTHGFAAFFTGMILGGVLTLLAFLLHATFGLARRARGKLAQQRNRA